MSKVKFSKEAVEKFKKNPYVKTVSENGITYTEEFKNIFIQEHSEGIPTSIIFERYGFDVSVLGEARIYFASKRWRQQAKRDEDFTDKRVVSSGRPPSRELFEEETIERLKHKITILEQENSFDRATSKKKYNTRKIQMSYLQSILRFNSMDEIIAVRMDNFIQSIK